jgi:NADH:ubiquinone oxidoreductase subunit F (NADH-binding)
VLPRARLEGPVLVGGYHGGWAGPGGLVGLPVSPAAMRQVGLSLGAGIVLPLGSGCPVHRTSRVTAYLASQSAGRCGPCLNGLPALAEALEAVAAGRGGSAEVLRLGALVEGRGACAHPDGTVRLVRSLVTAYGDELLAHAHGRCDFAGRTTAARLRAPWLEVSA